MKTKIKLDKNLIICLMLFMLFFIIYIYFAAPTVWWGDSAEYSTMPYLSGVLHPPGYNMYLFVGKIFSFIPIGDIGFRANLLSVFFGALVAPLLFLLVYEITKNRFSSTIAALFFCFSFSFWSQAIIAEVHTLSMFFILLLLFLILKWSREKSTKMLYIFTFAWAISLSIHALNILFAPAFIYFVATGDFRTLKRKLPKLIIIFIIGMLPFLWTLISVNNFAPPPMAKYYFGSSIYPNNFNNFIKYVTVSEFDPLQPGFGFGELANRVFSYTKILQGNFIIIGVILGIIGIWEMLKENKRLAILLVLMFLGNMLYLLNHPASDMFSLYLPSFLIFSVWIGFGVSKIKSPYFRNILDNGYAKIIIVIMLAAVLFSITLYSSRFQSIGMAPVSHRDDWQTKVFAEKVFDATENNATVLTSWREYAVIYYYQKIYGKRIDIKIYEFRTENEILDFLGRIDTKNKLYFTSEDITTDGIDRLKEQYMLTKIFDLDFNTTKNYKILYEINKR